MIRVKRSHYDAFENNPPSMNGGCMSPHKKDVNEVIEPTKIYSSPLKKSKIKSDEKFVSKSSSFPSKKYDPRDIDVEKWFGYLPRPRRRHHQMMGSMYSSSDMAFSLEDVKHIVNGALKDFEEELRREYDSILLDRLSEQWETFARYNEDCIQQRLKNSTFSYMS